MAAANPETGLFPGLLEAPFVDAPEVKALAMDVLAKWDEFRELREAIALQKVRVAFLFETKPFDQNAEEFKPHTIAKVTKASPIWKSLTGYDIVVQFRRTFWQVWNGDEGDARCEAVLYHEWCHVELEAANQGAIKLSLRHHDVEEFRAAARRYGAALPGRKALVDAFLSWQRENGGADIVPLRAVDAVQPLVDLAESMGTDITITADGRSATIKGRRGGES